MPGVEDLFDDAADESDDGEDYDPNAAAADQAEEAADGEEGGSPPGSPEGEGDDLEDSSGGQQAVCPQLLLSALLMPSAPAAEDVALCSIPRVCSFLAPLLRGRWSLSRARSDGSERPRAYN